MKRRLRHVHASGRFTASKTQVIARLDYFLSADVRADVITLTEVSPDKYDQALIKWAKDNGWHLYHETVNGKDECAILSRFEFDKTETFRLTDLTLKVGRTAPLYLVTARIKGGPWVGVWHSPAHNGGLNPNLYPTKVYIDSLDGIEDARHQMHGGDGVILCGDWNVALDRPEIRAQLAKPYPRMKWIVPDANTNGGRPIDGDLSNRKGKATVLDQQDGFDHKPVLTVIDLAAAA